ncbi:MAG: peptide-methionine (R)-S-oxide reductase MsrB [Clostridiales bacterium]|nr:peptide-methionine (R)-S-oxide reductase MsrB [Clostridiales bacterium]
MDARERIVLSDDEWRVILAPERFRILRRAGTEPAGSGEYVDTEEDGVYRCAGCGAKLFSSADKYHSGSGWPSFASPARPNAVVEVEDHSYGMARTEVRCARCDGHLGHVFPDGPPPGGQRYCLNSLALRLDRTDGESVTEITENS